jgi:hypothetical protein
MGRHTALEGSPVHPLVAEALLRRPAGTSGPRHAADEPRAEGGLGWPEPPAPTGGGLGWPGDLDVAAVDADRAAPAEDELQPAPRRGLRRIFGTGTAA